MPSVIRSRTLRSTLRRIAVLALAPAACGGSATVPGGNRAAPGALGDASPDVAVDDAPSTPPVPPPFGSCGGTVPSCDPGQFADGGTGACAPSWISGDGCNGGTVLYPCGLPASSLSGWYGACSAVCLGGSFNQCAVLVDGGPPGFESVQQALSDELADAGLVPAVVSCANACNGRRPARLAERPSEGSATLGEVLASGAYLEAASVLAFRELAAELEIHGATRALVDRLHRAARDEIRHARITAALAGARGCKVVEPCAHPGPVRDLLAIALHNAREGCVRETWGAACAMVQARSAGDRDVRSAMGRIARDERAHAQLSWDVAAWLGFRLTEEERALVARETERAIEELRAEVARPPRESVRRALGLPSPCVAQSMLRAMQGEVWVAAAA